MSAPSCRRFRRTAVILAVAAGVFGAAAPAAARDGTTPLAWEACGEAAGVECATATLPMDYDRPKGSKVNIALARLKAQDQDNRIGSLVYNFGGPGGPAVDYLQAVGGEGLFEVLNQRFDIVAFDPRGVGQSTPAIDCKADQEREGLYSVPFATPVNLDTNALLGKVQGYLAKCLANNGEILAHVSTANVARDMDRIRAALDEEKLNFLGFSYGTFVGATYATLFPENYRAMVLDGALDPDQYINRPMEGLFEQTAGFELAFGRFMQACAADQTACSGFGGSDPWTTFDELVERANATPIPATGYEPDPRPVTGDDILTATLFDLYNKRYWGELAQALAMAQNGDGSLIRQLVDQFFDRREDGTFGPFIDLYFTIGASEQRYKRGVQRYLERGDHSWGTFPHFWSNAGYVELNYGLWPIRDRDAFRGPFRVPDDAATPLVVGTTYDPATPYRGAVRLVRQLGNARLLTMRGDGHTAYGGNSACIDEHVNAYLFELALPAEGTICRQEVPFTAPEPPAASDEARVQTRVLERPRIRRR